MNSLAWEQEGGTEQRLQRRARGPRAVIATLLWLIVATNGLLMVWLWLHGGGVGAVHNTGDLLTSISRITGLLGAYLSLIQILLLARLPALEQLVGFDRLTVWHRLNGKITIILVLAHTVLVTVGYSLTDKLTVPREVTNLLDTYPHIVVATIGTGLMTLVVVSSLVIVRRRLPYEAWYAVHLTVYAAIALAYLHQVPTGNEFTANPGQRLYWHGLYVATLALLVLYRVLAPLMRANRHRLRVAHVERETADVVSVTITGRRLDRLGPRAGQFFLWRFLTPGRWWQSHPFSLSMAPDGAALRISAKGVGSFSRGLGELQVGCRVLAEGPFGTFTGHLSRRKRTLLIAGGIGITPLRALYEELPGELTLIYRAVSEADVVFRTELGQIARERGAELYFVLGDHRDPACAGLLSAEHLQQLVPDIAERDVFLCGPKGMMDVASASLASAGVPRRQIHSEVFAL